MTEPSARIANVSQHGVIATIRRGVALSPQIVRGIGLTLVLALVSAAGRIVVPMTIQRTIDDGILAESGPDAGRVITFAVLAVVGLLIAGLSAAGVQLRLISRTEAGLAALRVRAFRHIHDLSILTQNTERRGSLVSRVTADIDTITQFVQWGGIMLIVASLQLVVATVLMLVYSWQLTVVVYGCFVPLYLLFRAAQPRVNRAYVRLRERTGAMLGSMSEAVVGAETVRAYGVARRTAERIDRDIESTRVAGGRAQILVASTFTAGNLVSNLALSVVIVVGAYLGMGGALSAGTVVAFLFLVQLFTGPVQLATEILNELQNAVAGWRRVIAVIDTPVDVPDPADGVTSPRGRAHVTLTGVRYSYPDGPEVLHGIDLTLTPGTRVAIVGHTGGGKTTVAKLVARFMDPSAGTVTLDGVDLREITLASLRERIVLVPQEGFLFDGTVLDNVAYGLRGAGMPGTGSNVQRAAQNAFDMLGLTSWLRDLPQGLNTPCGQRGEALSAGERQLVALARAAMAGGDLMIFDEATSAVDPATDVRVARALEALTHGRSTITIAHRLSTAEAADVVVVVDGGHVVQVGSHTDLATEPGVYAAMHEAWISHTRSEVEAQ
ncbi:MAG: ABC transporter ATP-binding protein/permease [Cellulomonadaceae bacterium]|jgi:ABC-type multidrug transport system fused ATPase/permease subunit|nr:ABC transporter ATP-binding protein/permease [Cellulomonadaceae bacterium]